MEKVVKHIESFGDMNFTEDDIIEEVPEKSIEEIIREVADEEGLTEEEVAEAIEKMAQLKFGVKPKKRHTKAKRNDQKEKAKRKSAKKARKKNR